MLTTRLLERYYKKLYDEIHQLQELAEKARKKGYSHHVTIPTPITLGFNDRIKNIPEFQKVQEYLTKLPMTDGNFLKELLHLALNLLNREFGAKERLEALVLVTELTLTLLTRGMVLPGFAHRFQLSIDHSRQHLRVVPNLLLMSLPKFQAALSVFILDYFRKNLLLEPFRTTNFYVKNVLALMKKYLPSRWIERLTEERIIFLLRKIDIELQIPDGQAINALGTWFQLMESLLGLFYLLEAIAEHAPQLYRWLKDVEGHDDWSWLTDETLSLTRETPEYPFYLSETAMLQKTILEFSPLLQLTLKFHPVLGRTDLMDANAVGVHPATLYLLPGGNLGTHFILKFPQKALIVHAVPTLMVKGPLIELNDGSVIRAPDNLNDLKHVMNQVKYVHSWGELLIPIGLIDRNELHHNVRPNSLDGQTWINLLHLRQAEQETHHQHFSEITDILAVESKKIDEKMALDVSKNFKLYIHPSFHLYWDQLSVEEVIDLLQRARLDDEGEDFQSSKENPVISWPWSEDIRAKLLKIGASFQVTPDKENQGTKIIVLQEPRKIFQELIKAMHQQGTDLNETLQSLSKDTKVTEFLARMSKILFFPSSNALMHASYFPSGHAFLPPPSLDAHGLFPINGEDSQSMDFYQRKNEENELQVRLPVFSCPSCQQITWRMWCHSCNQPTMQAKICQNGHLKPLHANKCPECQKPTLFRKEQVINLSELLEDLENRLDASPASFLGVRKITNPLGLVEPPEKGFLRAKHEIKVARDGLIHVPTHFISATRVPFRLLTEQSVKHLPELGYQFPTHSPTKKQPDGSINEDVERWIELLPSDVIIPENVARDLLKIVRFLRDWLSYLGIEPPAQLRAREMEELLGQHVILYPHVGHVASCARIVGITRETAVMFVHPSLASTMTQNGMFNAIQLVHVLDHFLNFSPELLNLNEHGTSGMPLIIDLIEPYSLHFMRIDDLLVRYRGHLETATSNQKGYSPLAMTKFPLNNPYWDELRILVNMSTLRKNPNEQVFGLQAPLKENVAIMLDWLRELSQKTIQLEQQYQTTFEHGLWMLNCVLELATLNEHPLELLKPVTDDFLDELASLLHLTLTRYLSYPIACATCGRKFRRDLFTTTCPSCNHQWQPRSTLQKRTLKTWSTLRQLIKQVELPLPDSLRLPLSLIPRNEDASQ